MLKSEESVRRALEGMSRSLKRGEVAEIEVSENLLEFTIYEAISRRLSVIYAYEKEGRIVVVIERRHY